MVDGMKKNTFQDVYDNLVIKINGGELLPGMMLPTEKMLSTEYNLSRPTVRKALEMLEKAGRIVKRSGIGTFVSDPESEKNQSSPRRLLNFAVDSGGADYYSQILLRGMRTACEEHGCRITVDNISRLTSDAGKIYDGLILTTANQEDFDYYAELSASTGVPIAAINRFPSQGNIAYFSVNYVVEAARAVNYLLSLGHRSIALLGADDDNKVHGLRSKGWARAFEQNGLQIPEQLRFPCSSFRQNVTRLVDFLKEQKPTALFITNGCFVPQVMYSLGLAQLTVPQDIAILCFDDMEEMSDTLGIPMSYVKMPLTAMGRRAVEYLIQCHATPNRQPARMLFEASLVINSGCQAPR